MITETTYSEFDLTTGICTCCSEKSDEILIGDGRCIDCIEEEKFIEVTSKHLYCSRCGAMDSFDCSCIESDLF